MTQLHKGIAIGIVVGILAMYLWQRRAGGGGGGNPAPEG
jgi:hypothetical protein